MKMLKVHRGVSGALAAVAVLAFASYAAAEEGGYGKADPAQIGRGAKLWAENCNRCHNIRDPKEIRDYEWELSVTHMRVISGIPGDMARDIMAFLKASN
jgi:cytochrome c1